MDTSLSPSLRHFVDRQIKCGRFKNAGDVISAALQRMEATDGSAGTLADPVAPI